MPRCVKELCRYIERAKACQTTLNTKDLNDTPLIHDFTQFFYSVAPTLILVGISAICCIEGCFYMFFLFPFSHVFIFGNMFPESHGFVAMPVTRCIKDKCSNLSQSN